jgi:hypothetical protein
MRRAAVPVLRIFTDAEGGSEHVNADDPDPARQLIADWFADRLHTIPARPTNQPDITPNSEGTS